MSEPNAGRYYFHRELMPSLSSPSHVPFVYDRTQKVIPQPEIKCITPIGDPGGKQYTVEQLMASRAEEIIAAAKGRKIALTWSGGLDSTSTMWALMRAMNPTDITVVMNHKTIAEYPAFYEQYVKGRMPIIEMPEYAVESTMNKLAQDGFVTVTGEIGDQVFGTIKYMEYEDQADLLKPWQEVLTDLSVQTQDIYHKLVDACPVPMTTVKMFWWWFNYVIKYQGVQLRMMVNAPEARLNDNVFHFFDSKGWNDWCLYTDQEIRYPGSDSLMYKKPLKDYILAAGGDQDYYNTKGKVRSLIIYRGRLAPIYNVTTIDTDWVRA